MIFLGMLRRSLHVIKRARLVTLVVNFARLRVHYSLVVFIVKRIIKN